MKIVAVEAIPIQARLSDGDVYWGNQTWGHNKPAIASAPGLPPGDDRSAFPPFWRSRPAYSQSIDTTMVKITADNGLVGWGEAKAPVAPAVTAGIINDFMAGLLLDEDPTNPCLQWDRLYGAMRIRGHSTGFWMQAISGIDIALWDLTGKALGVPLYKLLGGGFRNRVKVYASGIPGVRADAPPEALESLRERARDIRNRGYLGTKVAIGLGVDADVRTLEIVRDEFGPDFTIFSDAAGMYSLHEALRLGRHLERLNIGWLEAPVPPEDLASAATLSASLSLPIANDQIFNRWQTRDMLLAGSIDVVQPDVCRSGGITECRRIAQLADAFGKASTPHVSIGSAVQFAASAHLAASAPNQTWMEFWYGANPLGGAILTQGSLQPAAGYLAVPDAPGLGIDINETALRQYEAVTA